MQNIGNLTNMPNKTAKINKRNRRLINIKLKREGRTPNQIKSKKRKEQRREANKIQYD